MNPSVIVRKSFLRCATIIPVFYLGIAACDGSQHSLTGVDRTPSRLRATSVGLTNNNYAPADSTQSTNGAENPPLALGISVP